MQAHSKTGVQARSAPAPRRDRTQMSLHPDERRLIRLARQIGHGTLPNIKVRHGELILPATTRMRRQVRLDRPSREAPRCTSPDFKLKQQHLNLIERIRQIDNGTVHIHVQDGLPVNLTIDMEIGM